MARILEALGFSALVLIGTALATAAVAPGVKNQGRMIMTPPAQSLQVIPVPQGYVRDGYRYGGSNGDLPFFMDREWFYEGTIQGSA